PSPVNGRRASPSGPCRTVRKQPFSCEAGEGGAQRRMRARAKRAALALPRQHQKHASLRSRPLIRPPGTFSREREKGFSIRSLPHRPEAALLLRSGRRWREAPDEGASEASCSCPSRQHQKHASLRSRPLIRPPGTFFREREKGFSIRSLPHRPEKALLLRSGRRWRVAPDEGASEASCSCPSRQHQKH